MKVTQVRENDGALTMRTISIEAQIEAIRQETKVKPVSTMRELLNYTHPGEPNTYAKKLAKVMPAAAFRRTNGGMEMTHYNGIVQLDINNLANRLEVEQIKREVQELPQTVMAFAGSSERSVKVWVSFTRPDGTLPTTREEAEAFHAHAYRRAINHYQPSLSYPITLKAPTLEQYSRLSFDPELYYNPDATPIYLRQPLEMPQETTYEEAIRAEESPLRRLIPGYDSYKTLSALFEAALAEAFRQLGEYSREGDQKPLLTRLAENCFRAGIPEEEAARWSLHHFAEFHTPFLVRQTVQNIYTAAKGFGQKIPMTVEQELSFRTEEFMQRRYEFRYNTMSTGVEYRERNTFCFNFQPLNNRARNSIAINALQEGLKLWDRDVTRYIESDRVPIFKPLESYLTSLYRCWDGQDHIRAMAERVPCSNPHWPELFRRWLLNMVAHWRGMDKKYANCTVPLLVGPQGYRKSTFI